MISRLVQKMLMSMALVFGVATVSVAPVGAINVIKDACTGANSTTTVCDAAGKDDAGNLIENVIGILLWAIGVISVIMIVVGGIRYALSAGNSSSITAAKDTVLYAVIGLVVALLSYAIVKFVVGWF